MSAIPEIFLDTSALFSGIWSASGEGRMLLKLGEVGAIRLFVTSQLLTELERALRRKAPGSLGVQAILLDRSRIEIVADAEEQVVNYCYALVNYKPDAMIIAAAISAEVDYFVTLDRKHFLDNEKLKAAIPFILGTPGDCLAWYGQQINNNQ